MRILALVAILVVGLTVVLLIVGGLVMHRRLEKRPPPPPINDPNAANPFNPF